MSHTAKLPVPSRGPCTPRKADVTESSSGQQRPKGSSGPQIMSKTGPAAARITGKTKQSSLAHSHIFLARLWFTRTWKETRPTNRLPSFCFLCPVLWLFFLHFFLGTFLFYCFFFFKFCVFLVYSFQYFTNLSTHLFSYWALFSNPLSLPL